MNDMRSEKLQQPVQRDRKHTRMRWERVCVTYQERIIDTDRNPKRTHTNFGTIISVPRTSAIGILRRE
jgi:hypothetical protein